MDEENNKGERGSSAPNHSIFRQSLKMRATIVASNNTPADRRRVLKATAEKDAKA